MKNSFNVVLIEPEIPQNTGNIARLCACTGCGLHLVGKLGFVLSEKHAKRAGLDYWDSVDIHRYNSLDELTAKNPDSDFYFLTTKSEKKYTDVILKPGDFLVFGPETRGIDANILDSNPDKSITIPMVQGQRSLNLSNAVAIVVYEAIRQSGVL